VDPFPVINAIGLTAFAFVGATKAIRERFDLFGVAVVGLVTAFAGGTTRDLLVNRVPLALSSPVEVAVGTFGVVAAVGVGAAIESANDHPVTVFADAVGLASFATAGAIVATNAEIGGFGVVALAVVNAVGGGAFADVLLDRSPFVLLDDFYASCAFLGGLAYWLAVQLGVSGELSAFLCVSVTFGTRILAVRYGWEVPTAQTLRMAD